MFAFQKDQKQKYGMHGDHIWEKTVPADGTQQAGTRHRRTHVPSVTSVNRLLLAAAAVFFLAACLHAAPPRYWEKFPKPPGRSLGVSSIGLDAEGGLWIMAGQGCYYWDAEQMEWVGPLLSSGQFLTQLYGNPETGLYATQMGKKDHYGKVYRLEKGKADYVTDFYYDVGHACPRFCVSRDGRLVNWSKEKLRVFADGEWIETEADFPWPAGVRVFDRKETISLYSDNQLYVVDKQNNITKVAVEKRFDQKATTGVLWGNDLAIVLKFSSPGVSAFDVRTGRTVDASAVNEVLGKHRLYDLFRTPDGAVWIMARVRELGRVLYRVAPDDTTTQVTATAGFSFANCHFSRGHSVSADHAGTLWFASENVGIFNLKNGIVKQFDHRKDGSPPSSRLIVAGPDGIIYAGENDTLCAYNNGASLTGLPRPKYEPVTTPGEMVWKIDLKQWDQLTGVWYIDGLLLFTSRREKDLRAVDPKSGETRFSLPTNATNVDLLWMTHANRPGRFTACLQGRILEVDSSSGKTLRSVEYKRDYRITPIPVEEDYVLVPDYNGLMLRRIDPSGSLVWSYELPDCLKVHPSAYGSLLIIQTRRGSYGGQATSGIDLTNGKLLWSDTVDAYGSGVAFADDARYCVEGDTWLSPDATKGRLICRKPSTGAVLWTYSVPQATLNHAPVLDRATDRVYAALDEGTVVCVDGKTGVGLWKTTLPEKPLAAPATSYHPYRSSISLHDGLLYITGSLATLFVLDTKTGDIRERIALTEDVVRQGKVVGRKELAAPPLVVGDLLIVPTESGITAYRHGFTRHGEEGVRPPVRSRPGTVADCGAAIQPPASPPSPDTRLWPCGPSNSCIRSWGDCRFRERRGPSSVRSSRVPTRASWRSRGCSRFSRGCPTVPSRRRRSRGGRGGCGFRPGRSY